MLAEYRGDQKLAISLWGEYRRLNASYGNLAPLASHRVAVIAMKQQNLPLAISYCRQILNEGSNELFATALSNLLGLLLATDAFDEARRTELSCFRSCAGPTRTASLAGSQSNTWRLRPH